MSNPTPRTPNGRLSTRIALITGSSGRLGRAISLLFAHEGATLCLADKYSTPRNPFNAETGKADDWETRYSAPLPASSSSLSSSQQQSPGDDEAEKWTPTHELIQRRHGADTAMFHAADLTDEAQVEGLIAACVKRYGRIDILVNAHGISVESTHPRPLPIHETSLADYAKTMAINSTSLFLTMKYFLARVMRQDQVFEGGRAWIVNVASVQAVTPYYGTSSYCASKGAALMLTKQVALDYAPVGVRCNAVCPGFLDSEMTRNLQGDEGLLRTVAERHPLTTGLVGGQKGDVAGPAMGPGRGGLGRVEDVARMVLVLASDDARWMTGQGVVVDGGYSIS